MKNRSAQERFSEENLIDPPLSPCGIIQAMNIVKNIKDFCSVYEDKSAIHVYTRPSSRSIHLGAMIMSVVKNDPTYDNLVQLFTFIAQERKNHNSTVSTASCSNLTTLGCYDCEKFKSHL